MRYQTTIRMKAFQIPAVMAFWLDKSLPVDFTVKLHKEGGFRLIGVTVTGSTMEELSSKLQAFANLMQCHGFSETGIRQEEPVKI